MTIKALIWDMEGVLLNDHSGNLPAHIARRLDAPVEKTTEVLFSEANDLVDLGKISYDEFMDYFLDQLGKPRSMKPILQNVFEEDLCIDQELLALIDEYHKTYKTGIITNYTNDMRKNMEGIWAIGDTFDEVIISCEVGMVKPDPGIYKLMLEKLGIAPQEAVFIDDRPKNIAGAKEVGMYTILFENKEQALADLDELLRVHS